MKSIWGEPDRTHYWEASLIGDLVCGYCSKTKVVTFSGRNMMADGILMNAGPHECRSCKKRVILKEEAIELVRGRLRALPGEARSESDRYWKGEDPYGS